MLVVLALVYQDAKQRENAPISPPPEHDHGQEEQAGAMPQGSTGADPLDITGVISLSPELLNKAPEARAVYIIARPAGSTSGMPIAASRMPASREPFQYSIGPADVMMGEADFNQPLQIQVRWDQDGEASSRSTGDIIGEPSQNPVKPGTKGLDIVLTQVIGEAEGAGPLAAPEEAKEPVEEAASAPSEAPVGEGQRIVGLITVADSLKADVPSGGFFFIIARAAGVDAGPPLAVHKIPASSEPTPFVLGPEHMMLPGDFTRPMSLSVRWDQDGSASANPGDLVGEPEGNPVQAGAKDVKVVLTKKL